MKLKRIIRIIIMLLSVFVAYMIYRSEYNIKPEIYDIERAIEDFLEKDVTVKEITDLDNKIVVYYTLGNNDTLGSTILHRGINFRYQIRDAGYRTRNRVLMGDSFNANGREYLAIMGTNYDLRIDNFSIETYSGESFHAKTYNKNEVLIVFETKEETFLKNYTLYDDKGTDITKDMYTYLTTRKASSTGKFKAELSLLNVFCVIVLAIGFAITRLFKDKSIRTGHVKEDGADIV